VCDVLDVACSNAAQRAKRTGLWRDRRRGSRRTNDAALVVELKTEITDVASYGYRRACALVNRRRDVAKLPKLSGSITSASSSGSTSPIRSDDGAARSYAITTVRIKALFGQRVTDGPGARASQVP